MLSQRYLRESGVWIAAFLLTVLAGPWLGARLEGLGLPRGLAMLPIVVAIAGGFWVELRQISRMDEMQRLIYLMATMSGSMLAVAFCAVAYLGEVVAGWPRVAPVWVIAVLGAGFVAGWFGAQRRFE